MADEEKAAPLDREQVISLIGKHAKQLAALAKQQGCTTLSYVLQLAADQAEKDLTKAHGNGESGVS
jgi:Fe-S cluster assembly iron-binding protein IscA